MRSPLLVLALACALLSARSTPAHAWAWGDTLTTIMKPLPNLPQPARPGDRARPRRRRVRGHARAVGARLRRPGGHEGGDVRSRAGVGRDRARHEPTRRQGAARVPERLLLRADLGHAPARAHVLDAGR